MENVCERLGSFGTLGGLPEDGGKRCDEIFCTFWTMGNLDVMKIEIYMHRMFPKDTSTSLLPRAAKHVWLEGASVCTGVCV